MYGNSIICDVCKFTEIVSPEHAILMTDMTVPPGWLRIYANTPRRFSWAVDSDASNIERAYDCCSLMCARSAINEHHDNILHREEEKAASE